MANKIRIYNKNEIEMFRLQTFAKMVNDLMEVKGNYDDFVKVRTVYYDLGQNWQYSALIMHEVVEAFGKTVSEYQLFCPRDYELIISTDSIKKLWRMADYYVNLKETKQWSYRNSLYSKFE